VINSFQKHIPLQETYSEMLLVQPRLTESRQAIPFPSRVAVVLITLNRQNQLQTNPTENERMNKRIGKSHPIQDL